MPRTVIENPVINSPFAEPTRHFRFADDGITDEVVEARRVSSYFIPIPRPRSRNKQQLLFETEWTQERVKENEFINRVRERVALWRRGGYVGVTATTRRLLEHWQSPERERRLFFCQVEALETAIYITEVANRYGDAWIENDLREANAGANPLNLIVEVSGYQEKDKVAKVATATNLWVPAVNNHGGFGRWAFIEISDPWDAQHAIRAFLATLAAKEAA